MAAGKKQDPAHPSRPKYGLQIPKGWHTCADSPCTGCKLPACLIDPNNEPWHPTCRENRGRKRR